MGLEGEKRLLQLIPTSPAKALLSETATTSTVSAADRTYRQMLVPCAVHPGVCPKLLCSSSPHVPQTMPARSQLDFRCAHQRPARIGLNPRTLWSHWDRGLHHLRRQRRKGIPMWPQLTWDLLTPCSWHLIQRDPAIH